MTILIDNAHWPNHDRMWCHLVSDVSLNELHTFAARLGIPERGFSADHYDVPEEMRPAAIAMGAHPVESRELIQRLTAAGLRKRVTR